MAKDETDASVKSLEQQMRLQQSIATYVVEVNKSREKELSLLQNITKVTAGNRQITQDVSARLQEVNAGVVEGSKKVKDSREAWGAMGAMYDKVKDSASKFSEEIKETAKRLADQGVAASASKEGVAGLGMAFGLLGVGAKVGISVLGGMVRSIWELGKGILAIPIGIFTSLVDEASQMSGDNALAQAFEDLRKEMGAFNQHESQDVIKSFRSMRGELSNTGLSVYRVFGSLADRLKEVTKLASEMGAVWHVQSDNIARNAEAVMAFQKGLGLTGEMMKAIGARASVLGRSISEPLREMAGMALQLGRQFNMSSKLISRDVGEMTKDFKNFGGLGIRVMSSVAVFARKLGVDFKGLLGVVDKFDNFEDAATNAAKLSQSFGLNIDAMKMMKEQDPAARFEMLRKSFAATGRSVEQMTRQERSLLATTTGLSEEVVIQGLALKNQGVSYADIQRKAATAEHRQLSQAEAMKQLASSIERLTKSGQLQKGGFWDQFVRGLDSGMRRSMSFRQLMMTLNRDLRETYMGGRRVGRAFIEMFPGIKDVLGGITKIFERGRFRTMMRGVVEEFKTFFRAVQTDPKAGLLTLFKNLKNNFFSWFEPNSTNGNRILGGFKSFFTAMSGITAGLADQVMKGITQAVSGITEFIRNPAAFLNAASSGGSGLIGFVKDMLTPIWRSIKDSWPALKNALFGDQGLFTTIWDKLGDAWDKNKDKILGFLKEYAGHVGSYLLVAFTARAFMGGIAAGIAKALVGSLASGISQAGPAAAGASSIGQAVAGLSGAVESVSGAAGSVGGALSGAPPPSAAEGGAIAGFVKALNGLEWKSIGKLTLVLIGLAGALAVGGVAMAGAIVAIDSIFKKGNVNAGGIAAALGVIAVTAISLVPVAFATKLLKDVKMGELMKGLGTIALTMGVIGLTFAAIMLGMQLGDVGSSDVQNVANATKSMVAVFLSSAGLVVAAMGIGLLVSSGVGGLVAIAGMATLSSVVGKVAVTVKDIIKELGELRVDSTLNSKIAAFTSITGAINSIAQTFVSFIKATAPSFAELITGQGTFSGNFKSVDKFLKDMIGNEHGGLVGMIFSIKTVIAAVGSDANAAKGAAVLGPLLSGIGEVLKAMTPSDAFWKATEEFNKNWSVSNSSGITQLSEYMSSTMGQIRMLLRVVKDAVKDFATINISENQIKALGAIGPLLTGLGAMVSSIMPGPAFWKAATSTTTSSLLGGTLGSATGGVGTVTASGANAGAIGALQRFLVQGMVAFAGLFTTLGNFIERLGPVLNNVSPAQIQALGVIGPILSSVGTLMGVFRDVGHEVMSHAATGAIGTDAFASTLLEMTNSLSRMSDGLSLMMVTLNSVVRRMVIGDQNLGVTPDQIKGKVEQMKSMFDVLGLIPGVVRGFTVSQAEGGSGRMDMVGVQMIVGTLTGLMSTLFPVSGDGIFKKFSDGLKTVPPMSREGLNNLKAATTGLTQVSSAVSSIAAIKSSIDGLGVIDAATTTKLTTGLRGINSLVLAFSDPTSMSNLANMELFSANVEKFKNVARIIERAHFDHVHDVITGMVDKMNALSASLQQSINPQVDLRANLEVLAHNIGLGSAQDYTINHRNFEINMRVDVHIDSVDLKKILLGKPNYEFAAQNHTTPGIP
jgi:hypothetical protein